MKMRDLKVNVNGKELHLIDWKGSGAPIICVHGLTANGRCWDALAERLAPEYRVIAYDLPGRGDSAKPAAGYGIPAHAEDILAMIKQLGLNRVNLVGHSLGAAIGCYFAARYPERLEKLVLIDGGMDPDPRLREVLKPSLDRIGQVFATFQAYLDYHRSLPFFAEWSPYWEQYFYYDVVHHPDGSVSSKVSKDAVSQDIESFNTVSINDLHREIKTPTLVLWAPQGLVVPGVFVLTREKGEEIARIIPGSRFSVIENSNHYTIIMKEQVVHEIKEFLAN
ncbi:alpha/beta fold hydrolase [Desulfovirgula thermocuniculi]|uniref:alpha/beta fold hydrolase n=1 Tax=Desulfovirgula thermocuniculi TaxID=348842 RepID=UPI000428A1C7|nr:alpha/beta hydrolase [Desulfovirgula thermocuniculi]